MGESSKHDSSIQHSMLSSLEYLHRKSNSMSTSNMLDTSLTTDKDALLNESPERICHSSIKNIKHVKSKSLPFSLDESRKSSLLTYRYHQLCQTAREGTDHVVGAASFVAKKIATYSRKLLTHWDLPDWLRDNHYLHYMHRPQMETFRQCFYSIFSIHTETGNIWTHLIGLVLIISAMLFVYIRPKVTFDGYPHYPSGAIEILVYFAFFLGSCTCLTFSWLFHTLCCHSKNVNVLFAKLDYSGIALLICGSGIPAYYYVFYCNSTPRKIYISSSITLAVMCIVVSLWEKMSTPRFRAVRAIVFLSFGLSAIIPIVHQFLIYPYSFAVQSSQFYWLLSMGLCYVIGCLMYMFLIPERFFPGRINIIFQSHQIFHVLVVIAALLHLQALCGMSEFRVLIGRNCSLQNLSSY